MWWVRVQWYYSKAELSQQLRGLWVSGPLFHDDALTVFISASTEHGDVTSAFSLLILITLHSPVS